MSCNRNDEGGCCGCLLIIILICFLLSMCSKINRQDEMIKNLLEDKADPH